MIRIELFTSFAIEIIILLILLIATIVHTHQERARLEREIAWLEERNTHLREEVEQLKQQHTTRIVTKKPVILVIQKWSPKIKQEEVTPEISRDSPTHNPSPDDYDPNNFPINNNDEEEERDEEGDNWPWLFADWHH